MGTLIKRPKKTVNFYSSTNDPDNSRSKKLSAKQKHAIQFAEYNSLKNKVAREHQLAKLEEERNKFYESKVTLEDQVKTGDNDHTEVFILPMISQDDTAVI